MHRNVLFLALVTAACLSAPAAADESPAMAPATSGAPAAIAPMNSQSGPAPAPVATSPSLEQQLEALRSKLQAMSHSLDPNATPTPPAATAASGSSPAPAGEGPISRSQEALQSQLEQLRRDLQSLRQAVAAAGSAAPAPSPSPPPTAATQEAATASQPNPKEELTQLRAQVDALDELKQFREELSIVKQEIAAAKERLRQVQQSQAGEADAGNMRTYTRPALATSLVKDEHGRFGLWINPAKWKLSPYRSNPEAEFEFQNTAGNAFAFVIAEKLAIPADAIGNVALSNAQVAAPDAHVVLQERRRVNDQEVLCLQIEGTLQQAVPFTYLGYYYTSPSGTLQVVTSTTQTLFASNQSDLQDLLNGIEIYKTNK
jgi:chemotaxis protein histidine kinase CheA